MSVLVVPVLFFCAVLVAGFVKTRRAVVVFRWVADHPDRLLRRLLGAAIVPGLAAAVWLSVRGLPPPIAVAIGGLLTLGVLVTAAGLLGVEGGLVEPGSEAAVRVSLGQPPKTSTAGRVVAVSVGSALAAGAGALCWWAT